MNGTKDAHKLQKEKLESLAGGPEGKGSEHSANDPCFHCTSLINNWENSQTLSFKIWTCSSRGVRTFQ